MRARTTFPEHRGSGSRTSAPTWRSAPAPTAWAGSPHRSCRPAPRTCGIPRTPAARPSARAYGLSSPRRDQRPPERVAEPLRAGGDVGLEAREARLVLVGIEQAERRDVAAPN